MHLLIARTSIARFVSIDDRTMVRIDRYLSPDAYCDPPVAENATHVWGSCSNEEPDSFREIGSLEEALRDVASAPMIIAAAVASPRGFARMVASAHELSSVITVGSLAIAVLSDRIENARRFCAITVNRKTLTFHTLEPTSLYGANRRTPGVYAVSYSLPRLCVERNELVEPYPVPEEPRD
jgi:hypothetical protein